MDREKNKVDIESLLEKALEKKKFQFVRLTELVKGLTEEDRQSLGLAKSATLDAMKKALSPLPPRYQYSRFGNSDFVFGAPPADLVLEYIAFYKGKTFDQLNAKFPLAKERFAEVVDQLLEEGLLKARLRKSFKFELYPSGNEKEALEQTTVQVGPAGTDIDGATTALSDIGLFKQAYDEAGKGANYVFIHKIRRRLDWSRARFDNLLLKLMVEGYVAAHPGNPGALGADEVRDSFQDEYGDLYITISWRKTI